MEFKALGKSVTTFQGLETINVPASIELIEMESSELVSSCPVTGQPDFYNVRIQIEPTGKGIESKSLKLYLLTYASQEEGIFCEALADRIARDIFDACQPRACTVILKQNIRGGITIEARAVIRSGQ